jgi:hypothetical protein
MKIAKVLFIMVAGPIIGAGIGSVVAGLMLPKDPSGRGSPGDGFMVFYCVGMGLVVSVILSVLLAIRTWRRSTSAGT